MAHIDTTNRRGSEEVKNPISIVIKRDCIANIYQFTEKTYKVLHISGLAVMLLHLLTLSSIDFTPIMSYLLVMDVYTHY